MQGWEVEAAAAEPILIAVAASVATYGFITTLGSQSKFGEAVTRSKHAGLQAQA